MSGFKFSFPISPQDNAKKSNENIISSSFISNEKKPRLNTNATISTSIIRNSTRILQDDDVDEDDNKNKEIILPMLSRGHSKAPKIQESKSIHILDIASLMSNMTSLPHEWKRDRLILVLSENIDTATNDIVLSQQTTDHPRSIHRNNPIAIPPVHHYSNHEMVMERNVPSTSNKSIQYLERIDIHQQPFGKSSKKENQAGDNECTSQIFSGSNTTIQHSDLIPGYYEGGLKIWECSMDLCHYLFSLIQSNHEDLYYAIHALPCCCREDDTPTNNNVPNHEIKGGRILELGCGHGLPACLLFRELLRRHGHDDNDQKRHKRQFRVVFSDYNEFVLRDVTLPNILLNCHVDTRPPPPTLLQARDLQQLCFLVSGDWMELSRQLQLQSQSQALHTNNHSHNNTLPSQYDIILAAETTYTIQSAEETAYLLSHHLDPDTGLGFVATKRYYFGVGGGSDAFCSACVRYGLAVELLQEFQDGKSNIRDLWKVKVKKN